MESWYWLLFGLFLGCTATRSAYEWLKARGRIDPGNRLVFGLIALDMTVLWITWFSMCRVDPVELHLPQTVMWAGLGTTALATCLAIGALAQLRGVENIKQLRTGGLFALMRHPMYTGFELWLIGWPLYNDAASGFLAGAFGIANVIYWRRVEEQALVKQFGRTYEDYRKATWF